MENEVYENTEATNTTSEVIDNETGQVIGNVEPVHQTQVNDDSKTGAIVAGGVATAGVAAGFAVRSLYEAHKGKLHKDHKLTWFEKHIQHKKPEDVFRIEIPEGMDLFKIDENGNPIIEDTTKAEVK